MFWDIANTFGYYDHRAKVSDCEDLLKLSSKLQLPLIEIIRPISFAFTFRGVNVRYLDSYSNIVNKYEDYIKNSPFIEVKQMLKFKPIFMQDEIDAMWNSLSKKYANIKSSVRCLIYGGDQLSRIRELPKGAIFEDLNLYLDAYSVYIHEVINKSGCVSHIIVLVPRFTDGSSFDEKLIFSKIKSLDLVNELSNLFILSTTIVTSESSHFIFIPYNISVKDSFAMGSCLIDENFKANFYDICYDKFPLSLEIKDKCLKATTNKYPINGGGDLLQNGIALTAGDISLTFGFSRGLEGIDVPYVVSNMSHGRDYLSSVYGDYNNYLNSIGKHSEILYLIAPAGSIYDKNFNNLYSFRNSFIFGAICPIDYSSFYLTRINSFLAPVSNALSYCFSNFNDFLSSVGFLSSDWIFKDFNSTNEKGIKMTNHFCRKNSYAEYKRLNKLPYSEGEFYDFSFYHGDQLCITPNFVFNYKSSFNRQCGFFVEGGKMFSTSRISFFNNSYAALNNYRISNWYCSAGLFSILGTMYISLATNRSYSTLSAKLLSNPIFESLYGFSFNINSIDISDNDVDLFKVSNSKVLSAKVKSKKFRFPFAIFANYSISLNDGNMVVFPFNECNYISNSLVSIPCYSSHELFKENQIEKLGNLHKSLGIYFDVIKNKVLNKKYKLSLRVGLITHYLSRVEGFGCVKLTRSIGPLDVTLKISLPLSMFWSNPLFDISVKNNMAKDYERIRKYSSHN